jgi:hypothetical protein
MRFIWLAAIVFSSMAQVSEAALVGTELLFQTIYQATSTSQAIGVISLKTVTVKEPGLEIPSVKALEVSNPTGLSVVDISINAGNNFIELDFDRSAPFTLFASGFRNSYVFTFDDIVRPSISAAFIDRNVTTLGLSDSDVTFAGNRLEVNVRGLPFNTSTFARIDLGLTPVPLPAGVWLFGTGLVALGAMKMKWRKDL